MTTDDRGPDVVIVGAGMSGIAAAVALQRSGQNSFVIVERSRGVGGTWWDNRYPGAQCDVPSHLYSFSFAPNAGWSRVFAASAEIQAYVERCAQQLGLAARLRLGVTVTSATWDETVRRWRVTTDDGTVLTPRALIVSLGPLSRARYPDGIDRFRGTVIHTSCWPAGLDVAGRRIAVIGSAASAVQVVPPLAERARQVAVFQRTPSWIVARPDRPYRRLERALFRLRPWARLYRWLIYWEFEARIPAFKGRGLMHAVLRRMASRHLEDQVADPALRERLRPRYPIGCKRILLSNDFYPALQRDNVRLVSGAAMGFTAEGVVTVDGTVTAADIVVCATGFDTLDPLAAMRVVGRAGRTLAEAWRDGPEAYRGVTVPAFPNLFLMLGPNTATGHTSVLIPIEAQARYAARCLQELGRRGAASLEVRADASRRYNDEIQARLARTVWASPACSSWYKTAAGKVLALYPGPITRYALELRRPRFGDYVFDSTSDGLP